MPKANLNSGHIRQVVKRTSLSELHVIKPKRREPILREHFAAFRPVQPVRLDQIDAGIRFYEANGTYQKLKRFSSVHRKSLGDLAHDIPQPGLLMSGMDDDLVESIHVEVGRRIQLGNGF